MEWLCHLIKRYPEIKEEIKEVLEDDLPQCGHVYSIAKAYCSHCGEWRYITQLHRRKDRGSIYCDECGHRVSLSSKHKKRGSKIDRIRKRLYALLLEENKIKVRA